MFRFIAEQVTTGSVNIISILQTSFGTIYTRGTHTHIPYGDIGKEIVGNLHLSIEREKCLMLMPYLVARPPCGAGLGSNLREDARCGVDVVSRVIPGAIHVSGACAECQTVMVVVFAIVAVAVVEAVAEGIQCIVVVVDFGLLGPCGIVAGVKLVHGVDLCTAGYAKTHSFREHDAIPRLNDGIDTLVLGQLFGQLIGEKGSQPPVAPGTCLAFVIGLSVRHIIEFKLQHLVAAEDGDVRQVGALFIVYPVGIGVTLIERITHHVVIAVDVSAFDVYLQV